MDTMKDDVTYVISKMTGRPYTDHMFSFHRPNTTNESAKLYLEFYRNLEMGLIEKIDKAFDRDYRLFGYEPLSSLLGYTKTR